MIDVDDFVLSRKRQIGNPSSYCLSKKHPKPINILINIDKVCFNDKLILILNMYTFEKKIAHRRICAIL